MGTSLIEKLRDAGFQYSANALYDQAADRLELLERVRKAAHDYQTKAWYLGEAAVQELREALAACPEESK